MKENIKFFCIIFIFLICGSISFSQILPFLNYKEKNGLPSSIVYCICQDAQGYLWMGTDNGLTRFDGIEFLSYKKKEEVLGEINVIFSDRKGKLSIGTSKGCQSVFFSDGKMNFINQNNLNDRSVYSIVEDGKGLIWFGTSMGLSRFDGENMLHLDLNHRFAFKEVLAIAIEKKQKLWIGTDHGLFYCENDNFKTIFPINELKDKAISTLLYDRDDNLWIGTRNGLYRFHNGKLTLYNISGLYNVRITSIIESLNGSIWIGTSNGVNHLYKGKFTNYYSTINGVPSNFIYSITEDQEGNIWFGTDDGVSCLSSLHLKIYNKENGLIANSVKDICQDKKGRYWIATQEGLICFDEGHFINYTKKNGLINNIINTLMVDHSGNIWIATINGLSIFSSGHFRNYDEKKGLPNNTLFKIIESRDGTIWIASKRGLTRFKNGRFLPPQFPVEKDNVLCILEDSHGNLWFSSMNNLYKYSENRLTTPYSGNEIDFIFEDTKGKIWFNTQDGLYCYDKDKLSSYNTNNSSLLDNTCYCIAEDALGKLWIGHPKGISCFDGKEFKTFTSERLGLTRRSWGSILKDNDGHLWFGTNEGIIDFDPTLIQPNIIPPPIYITSIKIMEKEKSLLEENDFPYHQNIFRFNFTGINFKDPGGIQYKYRMDNIDNDWQTTTDRSLFYPFLPPGAYTFKVKAVNSDGYESVKPAEYSFIIHPPFWQTWWFLAILVLLLSMFILLVIQWRIKRTKEKAELKARNTELEARNRQLVISQRLELMGILAAGTVHDLKNLLSVIIGYSRLMAQKFREREDHENIETIKDTAATAVQMAKQILSFARHKTPSGETIDLVMELTEILDTLKITQPKNIQVQRQLPSKPILLPLNPARFQQIIMNLCLNAFQAMPNGGQLTITLASTSGNEITLEISDTGAGIENENLDRIFDPFFTTKEKAQGSGLGLFVVKQIVTEYNGKIEVHSQPGKGTTFIIRFPLIIN